MDRPSAKYEIIHSIVSQKDNLQNVKELCNIAGVSRSGYYNWLASEDKRLEREAKDKHDFELPTPSEVMIKVFVASICAFCIWIRPF